MIQLKIEDLFDFVDMPEEIYTEFGKKNPFKLKPESNLMRNKLFKEIWESGKPNFIYNIFKINCSGIINDMEWQHTSFFDKEIARKVIFIINQSISSNPAFEMEWKSWQIEKRLM